MMHESSWSWLSYFPCLQFLKAVILITPISFIKFSNQYFSEIFYVLNIFLAIHILKNVVLRSIQYYRFELINFAPR